jgi:uridine phosphorylase
MSVTWSSRQVRCGWPIEYPAVADHSVVEALVRAARDTGTPAHVGVTCSTDTFYPGQERYDSYTGYVPRRFLGMTDEWRRLQVLNYEMEAATLLTLTSAMGLRGGTVAGVIVNRTRAEAITKADLDLGEGNSARVAVRAVELLLEEGA